MFKDVPGFDERLKDMYLAQGLTMRQIADVFECSPVAILGQLRRCGVQTRTLADYPRTEKQDMASKALSNYRVGAKTSEETRKKMSIAAKIRIQNKHHNYEFGGFEKRRQDGYIHVYLPTHPDSTKDGFVMKHRLVMERHLGTRIKKSEIVHHINHIRDDNRIDNLQLMTFSEHAALHMKERYEIRREVNC